MNELKVNDEECDLAKKKIITDCHLPSVRALHNRGLAGFPWFWGNDLFVLKHSVPNLAQGVYVNPSIPHEGTGGKCPLWADFVDHHC